MGRASIGTNNKSKVATLKLIFTIGFILLFCLPTFAKFQAFLEAQYQKCSSCNNYHKERNADASLNLAFDIVVDPNLSLGFVRFTLRDPEFESKRGSGSQNDVRKWREFRLDRESIQDLEAGVLIGTSSNLKILYLPEGRLIGWVRELKLNMDGAWSADHGKTYISSIQLLSEGEGENQQVLQTITQSVTAHPKVQVLKASVENPFNQSELLVQDWRHLDMGSSFNFIESLPSMLNLNYIDLVLEAQLQKCNACKKYHKNENTDAKIFFSFAIKLPAETALGALALKLENNQPVARDPRIWNFMKFDPSKAKPGKNGSLVWQSDFFQIVYQTDGLLFGIVRDLELTSTRDWKTRGGTQYQFSLHVLEKGFKENNIIKKLEGEVKAEAKEDLLLTKLFDPFGRKQVELNELMAIELDTQIIPVKFPWELGVNHNRVGQVPIENFDRPRIYVVVPVYREFYNQNIGALLSSMASQSVQAESDYDIHLIFNVNNTEAVDEDIKIENQETIAFLNALAENRVPTVRSNADLLKEAIFNVLASSLKIHVMDHVTVPYPERNIGRVRDDIIKYLVKTVPENKHHETIVAQLDADSRVPSAYANELFQSYQDQKVNFVLLNMEFGTERNSTLPVYRYMVLPQIWFASYDLYTASHVKLPRSGGPRVTGRLSVIKKVGGVPHKEMGEDAALIGEFQSHYSGSGRWLYNVFIEVSFRDRMDGYDAAYYHRLVNNTVELGDKEREIELTLIKHEKNIARQQGLENFRQAKLKELLAARARKVKVRLALLKLNVFELFHDGQIITIDHRIDLGLFTSSEFEVYAKKTIVEANNDLDRAAAEIANEFPHFLNISPPIESKLLARIEATTMTLVYERKILEDSSFNPQIHHAEIGLCASTLNQNLLIGAK